jgi:hypothetical protein
MNENKSGTGTLSQLNIRSARMHIPIIKKNADEEAYRDFDGSALDS